ncbi:tRNA (adenosine(37)-N6)-threonylcarbamoyltransferase complex dimerization subunit type 1 TsaB [Tenacibaculum sp. SG-28]|uniref:tRNA (adenosine(37)-N6)-threonylcarbamoyltransferase complex dimerization subunit type 1 TsaB n=1 Tax=Tenacibaculum sp. SG-28 TaxID=754426 RepID=UPI000CF4869C|nr:tRNA (adenosine(37)-N6)-threonylcarbamoyltransferase complex dimerization subunit type 1 TsaB [Tenacibaculum sp. SG-28]PQJ21221.1 tRNA (adenosine(37)-N6)-threonylcarbamoyltransferase complex dimerization subunit type 1 TsaB [Tenacibaculum sp. SG-28]
MATILNIETATKNCSVSIAKNGEILASRELNDGNYSHAEKLHVFIQELLASIPSESNTIDAVAVSKGPGSYTGLRIGVSAAKGFCYSRNIPLIAIETLASLARNISINEGYIVPMLDARRMEVYATVYDKNYTQKRSIAAEIIDSNSYAAFLNDKPVYFLGDGAEKCKTVLMHPNAKFIENKFPSSIQMAALSYEKYKKSDFVNVAYFEPFYLKDFIVTPQKKN